MIPRAFKVDLWDVGQGDSSVVHLPDGSLFIIDTGLEDSMLPAWLDAHPNVRIHSLVLTHNDADHAGCAMDILQRMHSRIGRFVFVDDRRGGSTTAMQTLSKVAANKKPLLVVGPHHGGPIKRDQKSYTLSFDQPQPENVFISVGTQNIHDHPVKKFIDLHRTRSRRVCCSQLVHCDRLRIENGEHLLNHHLSLGMRPPKSAKAITCRGPIQLTWNQAESKFDFDRFHEEHLKRLSEVKHPQCMPIILV